MRIRDFTMQHKYPFVVLHLEILGEEIDVNVHPTKMELRFGHQQEVYRFLYETVSGALHGRDLIPRVEAPEAPKATGNAEKHPIQQGNRNTGNPLSIRTVTPGEKIGSKENRLRRRKRGI